MENIKLRIFLEFSRPGAFALVGDYFIKTESPSGSIFLPAGES
jgi:hypothetical protein